jgi:hypothetical protein
VLLGVRVWIDNPSARRKWRTRTAVVSAVKEAFDREGVKIPFPQRELTGREEAGGFVLAEGQTLAGDVDAPTPEPDGGQDHDGRQGDADRDADRDDSERERGSDFGGGGS